MAAKSFLPRPPKLPKQERQAEERRLDALWEHCTGKPVSQIELSILRAAAEGGGSALVAPVGAAAGAPLVVLAGWYGCQDQYLAKYSQALADLGCHRLVYQDIAQHIGLQFYPNYLQPGLKALIYLTQK